MYIDPNRPAYRVLDPNGFYGPDDTLYIETADGYAEIYLDDEPNEQMEPLNEPARKKMAEYLDKLDNLGREAALKANRAYAGRPRTFDGALALATAVARASVPIMTAQKNTTTIERIEPNQVPEVGSANPRRGRGRPSKASLSISAA